VTGALSASRALWNRSHLDLRSDEILAQILDRGDLPEWRELYALAEADPDLRGRIVAAAWTVPMAFSGFWLAAMASLGEEIDWSRPWPEEVGV
jgi:hypothetical protein